MFDRIADRYDWMNRIISLGTDKRWRRRLLDSLSLQAGEYVLDVATGTGDVAIAVAERFQGVHVHGLDPSIGMLARARIKGQKSNANPAVQWVVGDAEDLPFDSNHFSACTIAFGIRNVLNRRRGIEEILRVVRPGGTIAILELGTPTGHWLSPLARFHVQNVVPRIGALLAGRQEYRYLQESIDQFPSSAIFRTQLTSAGLTDVRVSALTFGAAHLYTGRVADA